MVCAMMGLISTAVTSLLPPVIASRDVPAAAGADDQRFGAGPQHVGKARAFMQQVGALGVGEMVQIVTGDPGGGIGVDHDGWIAAASLIHQRDARDRVPAHELLPVRCDDLWRIGHRSSALFPLTAISATNANASVTAPARPRSVPARLYQMAADTANRTETAITVFGSAKIVQERNQQQAAAGRAEQIEEIDAIHALDGFPTAIETTAPEKKNGRALAK